MTRRPMCGADCMARRRASVSCGRAPSCMHACWSWFRRHHAAETFRQTPWTLMYCATAIPIMSTLADGVGAQRLYPQADEPRRSVPRPALNVMGLKAREIKSIGVGEVGRPVALAGDAGPGAHLKGSGHGGRNDLSAGRSRDFVLADRAGKKSRTVATVFVPGEANEQDINRARRIALVYRIFRRSSSRPTLFHRNCGQRPSAARTRQSPICKASNITRPWNAAPSRQANWQASIR